MADKKSKDQHKAGTRAVNAGRSPRDNFGFVNPPLYRGSTVLFETAESLRTSGQPYIYARRGAPTLAALEQAMCDLEGAHGAVVTPSGLNAITSTMLAFCEAGDHVLVSDNVYRPIRRFCDTILSRFAVTAEYFDPLDLAGFSRKLSDKTRLVFLESPGSQTMEMCDIPAFARAAHDRGCVVIMDNTWATPIYFRPLDHGVDISIISATKFLGGHSDLMLGLASANEAHWARLHGSHDRMGLYVGPDDVSLVLRGLRTLPVRLSRHGASGIEIANWLKARPEVADVLYPALPDDPGHDLWRRDFSGAPGVFSIVLKSYTTEQVNGLLNSLRLFGMGWSWGGFESLIVPFNPTKYRTASVWPHDGPALRLHVGLEDPADLIADLEHGLAALTT
jgi:cystathionine beta-lyase